jgi:hypothetical protein
MQSTTSLRPQILSRNINDERARGIAGGMCTFAVFKGGGVDTGTI